jgi:hypothetical protein
MDKKQLRFANSALQVLNFNENDESGFSDSDEFNNLYAGIISLAQEDDPVILMTNSSMYTLEEQAEEEADFSYYYKSRFGGS